jgi:hypothetical protein
MNNTIAPLATDPFDVMLTGWSFVRTKVLFAAIELEVFTVLDSGPLPIEELRERTGLHERGARDFLDMLVAMGILTRSGDTYQNSPAAGEYLVQGKPNYAGGFLMMLTGFMGPGWDSLTDTLRTGRAHGQTDDGEVPFGGVFDNPMALGFFLSGMDSVNGIVGPALAQRFDWTKHASFADLGGARGNLAAALVAAHPHLKGVVFDQPPVEPFFADHMANHGTAENVTFFGGDFFVDPLPAVEVMVIGNVLHDWSAEQRRTLIRKAYEALPAQGALILYDPMLDEERTRPDNLLLSLSMILTSPGGNESPPSEYKGYLEEAGFKVEDVIALPARATAVIGRKIG